MQSIAFHSVSTYYPKVQHRESSIDEQASAISVIVRRLTSHKSSIDDSHTEKTRGRPTKHHFQDIAIREGSSHTGLSPYWSSSWLAEARKEITC